MASGILRASRNWVRSSGGILIPDGYRIQSSVEKSRSLLQLKNDAKKILGLADKDGVLISEASDFSSLLSSAVKASDDFFIGGEVSNRAWLSVVQFSRVCDALLALEGTEDFKQLLRKLCSGSLNLLSRVQSQPKNFLWEGELLGMLRMCKLDAVMREPPDIVVTCLGEEIGIACKKLYSERNVEKVFSNGVRQLSGGFDHGMVAFNLDDLVPENFVLYESSETNAAERINVLNRKFIGYHARHFHKYLNSERVSAAFVSTSVPVNIGNDPQNLRNIRQSTVWTLPGSAGGINPAMRSFLGLLGNN